MSTSAVLAESTSIAMKPAVAKIAAKFQVTVPPEVRNLYGLQEGDLLEWRFDSELNALTVEPKRAALLSPVLDRKVAAVKKRRADQKRASETESQHNRSLVGR